MLITITIQGDSMLFKDEDFRKLYKSYIIIKNEKFAKQIAQTLKIDTIMDEELSDEEFKEKLFSIEVDEKINAIFAKPYIDHTAGISVLILSTAHIDADNVEIFKRESFDSIGNARKSSVADSEFEYLENLNVNEDFDPDYYSEFAQITDSYSVNEKVEMLRYVDILDDCRHEAFPDDYEVIFVKEDCQMEKMWVRCEDLTEDQLILGNLMNSPYQELGVDAGDEVLFFPYQPEGSDEWILICDLNNSE